jgi:NitT/TauT family transport system permease protein
VVDGQTSAPTQALGSTEAGSAGVKQARLQAAVEKETSRKSGRLSRRLQSRGYQVLTLVGVFVLWELASVALAIPKFLVPAPTEVVAEMLKQRTILLNHGLATLTEIIPGFIASILVGVPLAVLLTYSKTFEVTVYPLLVTAQIVPKVALAPLFVVWFGFGLAPKIIIAFLIAFFPIVIGTVVGLKSVAPEMLYLVVSMGASPWQAFWKVRFPNALPSIFGGLKVAITLAVVGAIVGEFVGADKGLGYVIQVANGRLDTPLLFAGIAALSFMGVILFGLVDLVERKVLRWHVSTRLEDLQTTM